MEITMKIILSIWGLGLYITYALIQGYKQAYYYHNRWKTNENLHFWYFWESLIVAILISLVYTNNHNGTLSIMSLCGTIISYGLIFPYFHDGMYYKIRNDLFISIYKLKWKDMTTTSDAKMNFTYNQRLIMLIIGSIIFIISTLINIIL